MLFELMHGDVAVASVDLEEVTGVMVHVAGVSDVEHMPMGTVVDGTVRPERLQRWWSSRAIPMSRKGIREVLERLDIPATEHIMMRSSGLSLSDHYWICPIGSSAEWSEANPFDNPFSDYVGDLLFGMDAGEGSIDLPSLDPATGGRLPKRWKVMDVRRCLIKSGTRPFRQEPFNEVAAGIIADSLGIDHVDYSVIDYGGTPCSVCEDFVTADTELVPAYQVMRSEVHDAGVSDYDHYVLCCVRHGIDAVPALDRMMILDYVIANGDRHLNNFGIIRDAHSLEWISPAPIYDSGSSMGFDCGEGSIASDAGRRCKPFSERWAEQMELVSDVGWIDFDALREGVGRTCEVFSKVEAFRETGRDAMIGELLESRVDGLEAWARTR